MPLELDRQRISASQARRGSNHKGREEPMAKKRIVVPLKPGHGNDEDTSVVEVVPGPRPYLWVGSEDRCYGTIGPKQAKKLIAGLVSEDSGEESA